MDAGRNGVAAFFRLLKKSPRFGIWISTSFAVSSICFVGFMSNYRPKYIQLTRARLDWARHRIDEFITDADAFLAERPYVLVRKVKRVGSMGHISFISPEAEFTPKQIQTKEERVKLVYRIKIDVDNPQHELKSNMPADAELLLE